MRRFLNAIMSVLSWPFAFIWNARVSALFNSVVNRMYSRIIAHRFNGARGLRVFGRPIMVTGAKNIKVGKNVEICRFARIDAIQHFPNTGQNFTPELELGDNVVIGANSVVTKDVPSFCVACGNPARVIRNQLDKK